MTRKVHALTALFKDLPVKSAVQLLSMSAVYDVRKGQVAILGPEGLISSTLSPYFSRPHALVASGLIH
jgi:hypothetical protein